MRTWGKRPRKQDPSQLCPATLAHLVLPDFHMATKALPHQAPGHRRGVGAAPRSPETRSHSKHPALLLLREASSPGAGVAVGMMLQQNPGRGNRCQNTFCSKLTVLEDAREKCIRGTGGKGNMSSKISQGKGVCICMLKAEHIGSLFDRLFARDKHLCEAKLCRTPVAACTLRGDLVMLVITWCHTRGRLLGLNAGEFGLLWQEPSWGGCSSGPPSSSGAGT